MNLTEDQIDDLILKELERWSGVLSYHELQYSVFGTWPVSKHPLAKYKQDSGHTRIIQARIRWLSRHGFIYRHPDGTWSITR